MFFLVGSYVIDLNFGLFVDRLMQRFSHVKVNMWCIAAWFITVVEYSSQIDAVRAVS
jgi:hypothetical protein